MSQRVAQYGTTTADPWEGAREPSEAPPKQAALDEAGTEAGEDESWREAEMSQTASLFTASQSIATSSIPPALFYFLTVIESLQTVALPFAQQQKFSVEFDAVAGIASYLFSWGSPFYGSTELLLIAICIFLASTLCICVTFLAWKAVENSRRQPTSLIGVSRKLSLLLSKAVLLPVLYLSVLVGTRTDLNVAVHPIMILALVVCFVVSAFSEFLIVDRRANEVGSASTGRVSFAFSLLRVASLIILTVLPYPSWCLLSNALLLAVAAHFHWTAVPFHALWINGVRLASLVFSSLLSALFAVWLILGGGAEVPVGFFVFTCIASILVGASMPVVIQRRIASLWSHVLVRNAFGQYSINPSTVNMEEGSAFLSSWMRSQSWFNENNAVLMMRFAPYHLFAGQNGDRVAAEGDADCQSSTTSTVQPSSPSGRVHPEDAFDGAGLDPNNLIRFVDLMMHAQIDSHPDDSSLYLHYGFFVLSTLYEVNEVRGDPRRRMTLLVQEAERTKMPLDLSFFTAMLRSFCSAENGGDSLEVIQRSLLMAQWRLSLVRAAYVRLWKVLLNPHKTDSLLEEALAIVENLETNCDAMYNGLLETYPRSPQVLRACASFYLSVKGDEKRAQELMETATRMEESSSSLSAKQMAATEEADELCENRGMWQESTVVSPAEPTLSMSSLTSPSGLVVRTARSARTNSDAYGSEVASQAAHQMKRRSVHSAAAVKQNRSMSPMSPTRPNAFAEDRETALSDAGRRSIGKSSNSFNTRSSEGGLSRSRIRNRECKTLKTLSRTMLLTYVVVVVFLTVLFAVSYSSITSYKQVNYLLLRTAQVQDHMQRMARLVRKAGREADATIYIQALRQETAFITSAMGELASGLKEADPAVADKWYRSPVSLELLPYAGANVSYQMETNLWKGYGEIMTFCDEFVSIISKEKQTGAQLLKLPSFFGIRQNSVASLRIAHSGLLDVYQQKEEEKQFNSAVVVQTIVATLLIGLPIALISLLFFLFLRQFDEERHASFGLFDALPKSVVRDAIHVASEGNVCGLISGRISTGAEMDSNAGNNDRPAGNAVLDSGVTSRVAAMSVSSTRNRLITTTLFFFTAFAFCMLGLYAMNISTYTTVRYDAAEIHWSSRLHAQLIATLSYAYQRSLSLSATGIEEAPKIHALLAETTAAYQSVRYGDSSKNLPGISEGRDKLLKLLFSKTCGGFDVTCSSMEGAFYAVVQSLRRYANDPNTTNAETTLKTLTSVYENKLAGQMDEFIDMMTYENYPKIDAAATICIVVFVVSVLLMTILYFGVMRQQISELENQRRRVDIVLLLAPTATIFKQDALRLYLVEGEPLITKKSDATSAGLSANGGAHSLWHSALFDYSKDGLVEVSENGFIVHMNRAALTMYGLVEQNAIGKPLSILISSAEAAEKINRQLSTAIKASATGGKDDAQSVSSGVRTTVFPPEESDARRGNQGHIFYTSLFLTIVIETKAKGSKPLCVLSIRDITDDRHKSQLLEQEKARSDQLLTNILPRSIATRLSNGDRNIADAYENVSVLFFDLVGFTSMSSKMPPQELVATLNDVFSGFDDIILQNGCEKIKTIGDAIMVASGLPEPRPDHGRALVQTGLEFIQHLKSVNEKRGLPLNCRIGINSGPVVAGVIGKMKFAYDLWSDTVNVASRMESTSLEGRIQVSRSSYELTYKFFDFEERTAVEVKGKGLMQCYLVIGPKQSESSS